MSYSPSRHVTVDDDVVVSPTGEQSPHRAERNPQAVSPDHGGKPRASEKSSRQYEAARAGPVPEQNSWDYQDLLSRLFSYGTAPPIVTLSGQAGVGKTTLAIHVAHRIGTGFPDGQLYASLLGADARRQDPAEVLAGFLRDLGVTGTDIFRGSRSTVLASGSRRDTGGKAGAQATAEAPPRAAAGRARPLPAVMGVIAPITADRSGSGPGHCLDDQAARAFASRPLPFPQVIARDQHEGGATARLRGPGGSPGGARRYHHEIRGRTRRSACSTPPELAPSDPAQAGPRAACLPDPPAGRGTSTRSFRASREANVLGSQAFCTYRRY